ncbi:dihydrofolate reductase family protein [Pontibacter korlensis]|uniref:Riboflavin biosynthesis protein RibD n=1 Tax=Pontibacter korlensis TaxID=400092 RepID=A0A0E3ZEM6_9BACT|nr:dihydrofolate reductase family protein [Pontibacter korlensis]AKD03078.1 riboflavin biosynthesis protein RibD [Pontibacter korlensis]
MRKVILYIAASLDGCIARPDGSTTWLHNEEYTLDGGDFGYSTLMQSIDTTLMGHNTYKVILGFDIPFPYTDKTNYVFSRSSHTNTEHVEFVQEEVVSFVQRLKQQNGKDIWLIGGGQINTLLLNAGLIDEIILTYIPIILGNGVPLFPPGAQEHQVQVQEVKNYKNGFVQMRLAAV